MRRSMKRYFTAVAISAIFFGCGKNENAFDASGTFEADEIILSSEVTGRILAFDHEEGDRILRSDTLVRIDPIGLPFQKATLEASLEAIDLKAATAQPQIRVIRQQIRGQESRVAALEARLQQLQHERERTEKLLQAEAATQKQLDDLTAQVRITEKEVEAARQQVDILQQQIQMQQEVASIQNRGLFSEKEPLEKQIEQVSDQIARSRVTSPIDGVILTKYMFEGEFATPGKALLKVADLSSLYLRAYFTGDQLPQLELGQEVDVFIDKGEDTYEQMKGVVSWIASEAEFTPKTIQTKDERADLVYAARIKVKNPGPLKIGMYGEVNLPETE